MTDTMKRKAAALAIATALAVPAEGLRRIAYYDPPGVLTVCFGHTGADVVKNKTYSMDECYRLLNQDMQVAVDTVERCVPGLPPKVLAAFADTVYNAGPTIVCDKKNSTAARLLYQGKLVEGCNQLPRWDKTTIAGVKVALPGLTKRRALAQQICLEGVA